MLIDMFIRVKDGQPFGHPIMGGNFRATWPEIDCGKLPPEFAYFLRVPPPKLTKHQIFDTPNPIYEWRNGIVCDIWNVRDMTEEEKQKLK